MLMKGQGSSLNSTQLDDMLSAGRVTDDHAAMNNAKRIGIPITRRVHHYHIKSSFIVSTDIVTSPGYNKTRHLY